jgi:hypothetical protein
MGEELGTMDVLLQLGGFFLVVLFTVGPVLGLLLLLNFRDRRQARLLVVVWQLTPKALADRIAVQVRCPALMRRPVVTVDMHACSRDEIWEASARWAASLPPPVWLLVRGKADHGLPFRFTVEATRHPLPRPPLQSSTVAG